VQGNNTFTKTVTGVNGGIISKSVHFQFQNARPVFTPIGNIVVTKGQGVRFVVSATDADDSELLYSASYIPTGAMFDAQTRVFYWVPQTTGTYWACFTVTDGYNLAYQGVVITVKLSDNHPPVINLPDQIVIQANSYYSALVATDPDRDILRYNTTGLPAGAYLYPTGGGFYWRPTTEQIGEYSITFIVSDGMATVTKQIKIRVVYAPHIFDSLWPTFGSPGTKISIWGSNFLPGNLTKVKFSKADTGTVEVPVQYYSSNSIACEVPRLFPGVYKLSVVTNGGESEWKNFTVVSPFIYSVSPYVITAAGQAVTIYGSYLGNNRGSVILQNLSGISYSPEIISWTPYMVVFKAPALPSGTYKVGVNTGVAQSNFLNIYKSLFKGFP